MIPKRYYLTLLSIVPMICSQVFWGFQALKIIKDRPHQFRLWMAGGGVVCALMIAGFLSMFGVGYGYVPRGPAVALQTTVNLWGMISTAAMVMLLIAKLVGSSLPQPFRQERRETLRLLAGVAVFSPAVAVGFGSFVERTSFEVCERGVDVSGLAPDLDGLRILLLSDIHMGAFLDARFLERVIAQSNELKPSIVFITGDLISVAEDPLDSCLDHLSRLRSDHGLYGCLGNHEIYAGAEDYTTKAGRRRGIDFLRGETRGLRIGKAELNIAGVDYEPFERRGHYLRNAERFVRPGALNVLLSHNPDVFPAAVSQGYDLVLSGHTHGGQVTFEILNRNLNPARILTPYVRGLYRQANSSIYVTRGIGTLGVPVRLGAKPEISILTLKRSA
jgi:predicted MPP superfamily phosphohydrolase